MILGEQEKRSNNMAKQLIGFFSADTSTEEISDAIGRALEKNDEKKFMGVVDPRAEDADEQIEELADKLADEAVKRRDAYLASEEGKEE